LDQFSLGLPKSPSGVEIKILKRLFTAEEAITLRLREDGEEPFDKVLEMGMAILKGKKKNLNLCTKESDPCYSTISILLISHLSCCSVSFELTNFSDMVRIALTS
jgi:hypothetical protein